MNITQVKIFPVEEEKLKAFVSVVFDHCFMVNDIKVIQGKDGLFLSMPSRRKKSGEFKDVAHPLNNETRRMIEETVLTEYRSVVDDATPRRPDREEDSEAEDAADAMPAVAASPPPDRLGTNGSGRPNLPPLRTGTERLAADTGRSAPPRAAQDAAASVRPASKPEPEKAEPEDDETGEPTLEEVQEMHLSDSFWTVS